MLVMLCHRQAVVISTSCDTCLHLLSLATTEYVESTFCWHPLSSSVCQEEVWWQEARHT
jgi:hypothetical protein